MVRISKIESPISELGHMSGSTISSVWLCLLCCRGTHCKMSEYGEKHGGLMGRAPSHGVEHLGRHLAACVVPLHTLKIFNGYQQKLGGKPDVMVRATCTYIESSSCLKGIAILIDHWLEIKIWRDQRNPYFVRILVDIF